MKLLKILFLLFASLTMEAQIIKNVLRNDCSGLPCLDYGEENYSLNKFIKLNFKEYVNKKNELTKVKMVYKLDNSMLFESKDISLEIFFSKDSFEIDTSVKYLFDKITDSKIYLSEHLKVYYAGKTEFTDNKYYYTKIENINMIFKKDIINVPDTIFNKFINPNLNNQYFALRPIEVYKTNNTICIYLMGDIDIEKNDGLIFNNEEQTYLTKIVYDYKNKVFKNLTLTARELYQYCWPQCENFWPF